MLSRDKIYNQRGCRCEQCCRRRSPRCPSAPLSLPVPPPPFRSKLSRSGSVSLRCASSQQCNPVPKPVRCSPLQVTDGATIRIYSSQHATVCQCCVVHCTTSIRMAAPSEPQDRGGTDSGHSTTWVAARTQASESVNLHGPHTVRSALNSTDAFRHLHG